jgi:hypothetical protein
VKSPEFKPQTCKKKERKKDKDRERKEGREKNSTKKSLEEIWR